MKVLTGFLTSVFGICVLAFSAPPVFGACEQCGPGSGWIDSCPGGIDTISDQAALVGIDLNLDCSTDTNMVLSSCGDMVVNRTAGSGGVINTMMVDLCLSGQGVTLVAGAGNGQGGVLSATSGQIVEDPSDDKVGHSSFDVFFEIDLGGGNFVYNQTPLTVEADITCVPPVALYVHPTGCVPLFDAPMGGTQVANLITAKHSVNKTAPQNPHIPTLSEWGVVVMVLLLIGAGTIVFGRMRRPQAT